MKFELKEKKVDTNPFKNLVKLEESSLTRIINGHDEKGYVMISASRGEFKENENNRRYKELCSKVKEKGYSYIPMYGGYKEEGSDRASVEKSLMVFPYNTITKEDADFDTFMSDMIELGTYYDQDSILIKTPTKERPAYYYLKDVDYGGDMVFKKGTWGKPFNSVKINDVQREYFTALKSWNDISLNKNGKDNWEGSPQRFTYQESYLRENSKTIMGRHSRYLLGELLDPEY